MPEIDKAQLLQYNHNAIQVIQLWLLCIEGRPHELDIQAFNSLHDWWIPSSATKFLQEYFDRTETLWFPTLPAPDICASCYSMFGYIVGGRVSNGCQLCQDPDTILTFLLSHMAVRFYVSQQHMIYLFAHALHKWSIAKPRKPQQTAKQLRKSHAYD